jgi:predicted nucleic acid-binding protein
MNSLLDTNVVSEWVKPRPDPGVITWLAEVDEDRVFLSVVTLAELRYSIERMPVGARRNRLNLWLREELPLRFTGRILPVTPAVAEAWGYVAAHEAKRGAAL